MAKITITKKYFGGGNPFASPGFLKYQEGIVEYDQKLKADAKRQQRIGNVKNALLPEAFGLLQESDSPQLKSAGKWGNLGSVAGGALGLSWLGPAALVGGLAYGQYKDTQQRKEQRAADQRLMGQELMSNRVNPFMGTMYAADGGMVPIQAEEYQGQKEMMRTPQGVVMPTNADTSHEGLHSRGMTAAATDAVPQGTDIFSARNKTTRKELQAVLNVLANAGVQIDPSIVDELPKKGKASPAELADSAKKKYGNKNTPNAFDTAALKERSLQAKLDKAFQINQILNGDILKQPQQQEQPMMAAGGGKAGRCPEGYVQETIKDQKGNNKIICVRSQTTFKGFGDIVTDLEGNTFSSREAAAKNIFTYDQTNYDASRLGSYKGMKSADLNMTSAHVIKGYLYTLREEAKDSNNTKLKTAIDSILQTPATQFTDAAKLAKLVEANLSPFVPKQELQKLTSQAMMFGVDQVPDFTMSSDVTRNPSGPPTNVGNQKAIDAYNFVDSSESNEHGNVAIEINGKIYYVNPYARRYDDAVKRNTRNFNRDMYEQFNDNFGDARFISTKENPIPVWSDSSGERKYNTQKEFEQALNDWVASFNGYIPPITQPQKAAVDTSPNVSLPQDVNSSIFTPEPVQQFPELVGSDQGNASTYLPPTLEDNVLLPNPDGTPSTNSDEVPLQSTRVSDAPQLLEAVPYEQQLPPYQQFPPIAPRSNPGNIAPTWEEFIKNNLPFIQTPPGLSNDGVRRNPKNSEGARLKYPDEGYKPLQRAGDNMVDDCAACIEEILKSGASEAEADLLCGCDHYKYDLDKSTPKGINPNLLSLGTGIGANLFQMISGKNQKMYNLPTLPDYTEQMPTELAGTNAMLEKMFSSIHPVLETMQGQNRNRHYNNIAAMWSDMQGKAGDFALNAATQKAGLQSAKVAAKQQRAGQQFTAEAQRNIDNTALRNKQTMMGADFLSTTQKNFSDALAKILKDNYDNRMVSVMESQAGMPPSTVSGLPGFIWDEKTKRYKLSFDTTT